MRDSHAIVRETIGFSSRCTQCHPGLHESQQDVCWLGCSEFSGDLSSRIEIQLCGHVDSTVDRPVDWALHFEDVMRPLCGVDLFWRHAFQ
jgi:hypothetical protein